MEDRQDKLTQAEVFKLTSTDIDHLFRRTGAVGNQLAEFQYDAQRAAVSTPSPWFKALAESPLVQKIGRLLLEPDLRIAFHTGGNTAAEDKYQVLLTREDHSVLAQFLDREGHILLLYFPDATAFAKWWASVYAPAGMDNYPTVFVGIQETEVLICALHCVDIYRRFYLESMLDYRALVDVSVTIADFVQLLKKSLASQDKRWLLPTMFELIPGLRSSNIALKPEHLKQLEAAGFITSQDSVLTLTERSRLMGTEFLSSWVSASGWHATTLVNGREKSLSRVFLAATAFANHLISFETGSGGESRFRHQALTETALVGSMSAWLQALRQTNVETTGTPSKPGAAGTPNASRSNAADKPNAAAIPNTSGTPGAGAIPAADTPNATTKPNPAAKPRFCGQCGAEIRPGKKFCTSCGTTL